MNKCTLEMTRKQAGISLISVIFILVVLASAAAFIINISALQQQSANLRLMETRAFFVAESGIEWAQLRIADLTEDDCNNDTVMLNMLIEKTKLEHYKGMSGFDLKVQCQGMSKHVHGGNAQYIYNIKSQGSFGFSGDRLYVSRVVTVQLPYTPSD